MEGKLAQYEIVTEIGRGGMGIVYQAIDKTNQRLVAIKKLVLENIDPAKQHEFEDRFKREAMMATKLSHPNIVTVYDVSVTGDDNFYVMEYLDGNSLHKEIELRGGKIPAPAYSTILNQIASGLEYAHSMGVVHRDIKPDNIFILKNGTVKITDFGIARTVDYEQTHLTKTGVMLGTLSYISPEQLQDAKTVDHRADIFSLAVVSYEALCGTLPFTGQGVASTVIKILSSEPVSAHLAAPGISLETATVISKALRKKARDRYMSVTDFSREFQQSLSEATPSTAPVSRPQNTLAQSKPSGQTAYSPGIPLELPKPAPPATKSNSVADTHSNPKAQATALPYALQSGPAAISSHALNDTEPDNLDASYLVKFLAILGRHGDSDGCFIEPSRVISRFGKIIVADTATRYIQILSRDGQFIRQLHCQLDHSPSQTSGGKVSTPSGLAIDGTGRIYVSDSSDYFVRVFNNQGLFIKEISVAKATNGGIQGITLDTGGLLYACDQHNACIQVVQADLGNWLRKIGTKGTSSGQLQLPSDIALDRHQQIYVVDYGQSCISIFSKSGSFIRAFGSKGTDKGQFNVPRGVVVDRNDRIYIADSLNHRIQIFGPAGDWLYTLGTRGTEAGKFINPCGLAIDPETNCLYVADRGNHRLQVFQLL